MTSIRPYASGPVMADGEFLQSALTRPLSIWQTAGMTLKQGALDSPVLGTALRDAYAEPLARTNNKNSRGFRFETPEEVAKRGDKLYTSQDEYKASPNFRENIPWEKGMTESRAKSLAEMNDSAAVRQFYGSKRPVTAFIGNLAGAALDPINYIPVVGEVAYAAAAARVGRIASRTLLGATDAALNAAIAGAITAPQRAKFGDDTSWQAIMMTSAYAAMAGAVVGGAVGSLTKGPKIKPERLTPASLDTPHVPVPESAVPIEPMGGKATARFEPVRNVTVADVVSRLETAANRIKAAEVMNDAVDGLVTRGEVALGERAKVSIRELQSSVEARADQPSALPQEEPAPGKAAETKDIFKTDPVTPAPARTVTDAGAVAAPDGTRPNLIRDEPRETASWVIRRKEDGEVLFETFDRAKVDALNTAKYEAVPIQEYLGSINGRPKDTPRIVRTDATFTVPGNPAPPANLKATEAKITANPKPDASPEQAAIDNAIADAKEEGFDPETGEHDLEPDIESLRNQELLTAEEEQALAAADETYDAIGAWEKVMQVARTCYLK